MKVLIFFQAGAARIDCLWMLQVFLQMLIKTGKANQNQRSITNKIINVMVSFFFKAKHIKDS